MNLSVNIVTIPVSDQDQALAFYRDKLGFTLGGDFPIGEGRGRWLTVRPPSGGATLALLIMQGQEDRVGTFNPVMFATDDVQKTHDELVARGVEMAEGVTQETWGKFFILKDQDGNMILVASH